MRHHVDTGLNLVFAEVAAAGHLLAEKGRIGERYILGGRLRREATRMLSRLLPGVPRRACVCRTAALAADAD